MDRIRDKPELVRLAPKLLKSVGVKLSKTKTGIKFVFTDIQVIDDLKQLGFSIDMLRVLGGEMPLPALAIHVDEQAALEAYWGAQAEKARYLYMLAQDEFEYWYQGKYSKFLSIISESVKTKPTQKEVEGRIARKCGKELKSKKDKLRILERDYRVLHNACFASIVTKGKMMQTLRNIVQGGNVRMPSVDAEVETVNITKIKATSD